MKHEQSSQGVTGFSSAIHAAEPGRLSAAIKLPVDLGIEDAAQLRASLQDSAGAEGPVTLDASDIQRIHTAALQLFCLFCRDRRAAGRDTRWHEPSNALRSAAALLGATTLLSLGKA